MTMCICRWGRCRWRPFLPEKAINVLCSPPNLMSACLQDAIDKGRFRDMADNGAPQMDRILETGLEVARGMAYLHQHDIVHGDLVRPCLSASRLMCMMWAALHAVGCSDCSRNCQQGRGEHTTWCMWTR